MIAKIRKHHRPPGAAVRATAPLGLARALEFAHLCGVGAPPADPRPPTQPKQPAAAHKPPSTVARDATFQQAQIMGRNTAILQHGVATGRVDLAIEVAFGRPSARDVAQLFE